jgi:hypothetical protein
MTGAQAVTSRNERHHFAAWKRFRFSSQNVSRSRHVTGRSGFVFDETERSNELSIVIHFGDESRRGWCGAQISMTG